MSFVFHPRLAVAVALALMVLIGLGVWQLQRRAWKEALIAGVEDRIAAAPIDLETARSAGDVREYTPVRLEGAIDSKKLAPVFGSFGPTPGVYLFAPVFSDDGAFLAYIDLGFIPQAAYEADDFATPVGVQEFVGLYRQAESDTGLAAALRPETKAGGYWYVRRPALFAAFDGLDAKPAQTGFYIDRAEDGDDLWPRGGTTRLDFPNRHLEYALTWFGLAATLIGVFLAYSLKRVA